MFDGTAPALVLRKVCTTCKRTLPATERNFYPRHTRDGLRAKCRRCMKLYKRARGKLEAEKERLWWKNVRAKYRGGIFTLTLDQWREAVRFFGNKCAYCLCISKLTIDHYIARSSPRYPGTTKGNTVPSCMSCNSSKSSRHPAEWCSDEALDRVRAFLGIVPVVGDDVPF